MSLCFLIINVSSGAKDGPSGEENHFGENFLTALLVALLIFLLFALFLGRLRECGEGELA
jgi:hypothetical protein